MQNLIKNKRFRLAPGARREIAITLKKTVAELFRLLAGIKYAHRRSCGAASAQLDNFAGQIMGHIGCVAERATAMEVVTPRRKAEAGSPPSYLLNIYRAQPGDTPVPAGQDLADLHVSASRNVRNAVRHLINAQDFGSADVLADVLRTLNRHTPLLGSNGHRKELMMN